MFQLFKQFVHQLRRWRDDWRWAADWNTLARLHKPVAGLQELTVRIAGKSAKVWVRGNTLDPQLARQILCDDSEYKLPVPLQPKVIFDIGANIGLTTLYFASLFPEARIVCFEPLPENLELLRKNVAALGARVSVIPQGLGDREGTFSYHPSNDPKNFGGGTFQTLGCNRSQTIFLPVTTLRKVCADLNIKEVDLIKIDTEGAEWDVLQGTAPELIENCSVIIGELHSHHDSDILAKLGRSHLLAYSKPLHRHAYPFVAVRSDQATLIAA